MVTFDKVKAIKYDFCHDYLRDSYTVNAVGISKVGILDKNCDPSEKDDHCLSVLLEKPLPQGLTIPNFYKGVKVIVRLGGPIRPL